MMKDDAVENHLHVKVKLEDSQPFLLVSVDSPCGNYQLTKEDLHKVFSCFGKVELIRLLMKDTCAIVLYSTWEAAETARIQLDEHPLRNLHGLLRVDWILPQRESESSENSLLYLVCRAVKKFTARYEVQIDSGNGFEVSKRIIGTKGIHMKRIHKNTQSKLRLRGLGSGYLEGYQKKEAEEPLHLCISCDSYSNYLSARLLAERLLKKIYREYDDWLKLCGKVPVRLTPKAQEIIIQFPIASLPSAPPSRKLLNEQRNDYVKQVPYQGLFSGKGQNKEFTDAHMKGTNIVPSYASLPPFTRDMHLKNTLQHSSGKKKFTSPSPPTRRKAVDNVEKS